MKNTSFIGLASYTEKDAAIFKGRSQAIDDGRYRGCVS